MTGRYFKFFLWLLLPLGAMGQDAEDIVVSVEDSIFKYEASCHGYYIANIRVVNRSPSSSHKVHLEIGNNIYDWTFIKKVERSLELGPNSQALVKLPIWSKATIQGDLRVRVDGKLLDQDFPMILSRTNNYELFRLHVLHGHHPSGKSLDWEALHKSVFPSGYDPSKDSMLKVIKEMPARFPDSWREYAGLDLIILPESEFLALEPAVRNALLTWVRNGSLLILEETSGELTLGDRVEKDPKLPGTQQFLGFGSVLFTSDFIFNWTDEEVKLLLTQIRYNQVPWFESQSDASEYLNLSKNIQAPLRSFFIIMLILAIFMGPVNVFYLHRRGKSIWLLITVPVISIAATFLILTYSIVTEGYQLSLKRMSLTYLDEGAGLATTLGRQVVYSPLTTNKGVHYHPDAEVMLQHNYNKAPWLEIDWTQDQHLARNLLKARLPVWLIHRHTAQRRERMVFEEENNTVKVTNGLGVNVTRLNFVDGAGKLWSVTDLQAGASAEMIPQEAMQEEYPSMFRTLYQNYWFSVKSSWTVLGTRQNPNTYTAWVDRNPFFDSQIQNVKSWEETAVIYGTRRQP